jgi:hypothetical protein
LAVVAVVEAGVQVIMVEVEVVEHFLPNAFQQK